MRLKESRTLLTVGMWGIITLTQVISLLKPYLSFNQLAAVAAVSVSTGIAFSYIYPEYIMKGEEKERQYRKGNFVNPRLYIAQQIDVAQMSVQAKAIAENWDVEKTLDELEKVTEEKIDEFFDGVEQGVVDEER